MKLESSFTDPSAREATICGSPAGYTTTEKAVVLKDPKPRGSAWQAKGDCLTILKESTDELFSELSPQKSSNGEPSTIETTMHTSSESPRGLPTGSTIPEQKYKCESLAIAYVAKDYYSHFPGCSHQPEIYFRQNEITLTGRGVSGIMKDFLQKSISEHEAKVVCVEESIDCFYLPALANPSVQKMIKEEAQGIPFEFLIASRMPNDSVTCHNSLDVLTQAFNCCKEKTVDAHELNHFIFSVNRYWWYWESESGFQPYEAAVCSRLEQALPFKQAIQESIGRYSYLLCTARMVQVNLSTKRERKIHRTIISGSKQCLSVCVRAHSEYIHEAKRRIFDTVKVFMTTNVLAIPDFLWDTSFVCSLLKMARHNFVDAYEASENNSIVLKGFPDVLQEIQLKSQSMISEEVNLQESLNIPMYWKYQRNNCELQEVKRRSDEWNFLEGCIQKQNFNASIVCIERIQNLWLWKMYDSSRRRMSEKNRGDVNEFMLFHGSRYTPPKKIYDSEQGFDHRLASHGRWGEGVYFAVKASYSNSYAHITPEGHRQMFLAQVLTGVTCRCPPNNKMKAPPKKSEMTPAGAPGSCEAFVFEDERYDSVSGITGGGYEIFVVYEHGKAYPVYLITYNAAA